MIAGLIGRLLREPVLRRPRPRCLSLLTRSEAEIRAAALQLRREHVQPAVIEALVRELVQLNTPALFLNIVRPGVPLRVVLRPSDGRTVRFRGDSYVVDTGAAAPEGVEAFLPGPCARTTVLYPTAPDHPVYVVSIEHQAASVYHGDFPPYLTHFTLLANGRLVTRAERLLHERGPQVWAA